MSGTELKQRLAAILAADVAGYSRLMAADERATVAALDAARAIFRTRIESNQGRVIDMAGDSVLAVFEIATGAVSAALAVQQELKGSSTDVPDDRRMRFRIGVHLGEAVIGNVGCSKRTEFTAIGDTVNIASRLEGVTKTLGCVIVGSRELIDSAGGKVITGKHEWVKVKGREQAIEVFEILGMENEEGEKDA